MGFGPFDPTAVKLRPRGGSKSVRIPRGRGRGRRGRGVRRPARGNASSSVTQEQPSAREETPSQAPQQNEGPTQSTAEPQEDSPESSPISRRGLSDSDPDREWKVLTRQDSSPAILQGSKSRSNTDAMMQWCQSKTTGYAGVDVTNFTSSWKDGKAFCALVSALRPGSISWADVEAKAVEDRLELAFSVLGSMGVPQLFDPDDITAVSVPDRLSMMTYISEIWRRYK